MGAKNTQFNTRGPFLGEYVSGKYVGYHAEQFTDATPQGDSASSSPKGHTATGGIISDYTDPSAGIVYRSHVFTSSGTFDITAISPSYGATVDYLVVAGGGGGGNNNGGGGGAGAVRYATGSPVSTSPGSYTIQVGGAGAGARYDLAGENDGADGTPSYFGTPITAPGGGGGGNGLNPGPWSHGEPGGSGGGGSTNNGDPGAGTGADYPGSLPLVSPTAGWGNAGGKGDPGGGTGPGGGGGGAGGAGEDCPSAPSPDGGGGGDGMTIPASAMTGYELKVAGGGGGGGPGGAGMTDNPVATAAGGAGVTPGGSPSPGKNGVSATGGGGGGGGAHPTSMGGNAGSGIVALRYQIGTISPGAKATGGSISLYNNMWIHTFVNSGTFATGPDWTATTVEYVVIGGGGSGGGLTYGGYYNDSGGGGGAGSYRTGTTPIGAHPVSTTIQIGAGGAGRNATTASGTSSYFGSPITAPGGGGGSIGGAPPPNSIKNGGPGGSGGGGSWDGSPGPSTGDSFPGTIGATPTAGWGHDGGNANPSPNQNSGGGGGAGGAGGAPTTPPVTAGVGGVGIQLPTTFRNPMSKVGAPGPTSPTVTGADTSGLYYVAAGGGSGAGTNATAGSGGAGGGGAGSVGQNGSGPSPTQVRGNDSLQSTGSGGGGAGSGNNPPVGNSGGSGGSGIVIVAYPA